MLEKLYRSLIERRAEMALSVFDQPPSDWAGFQKRFGQYVELAELIALVNQTMKGEEIDE
jgi:hypothetical protein